MLSRRPGGCCHCWSSARYAYPFLDYIESARTTTSVTSVPNVLRGVSDWVAYSPSLGEPTWPAGWALATHPPLMLATAAVAVIGLLGVAVRSCPERRFLAWSLATGVVIMAAGHDGPLAGPVRSLLDGPLVPFRNVHKAEPVLRIAVALGLAHALALLPGLVRAGWSRVPPDWGFPRADVVVRVAAGAVALVLVVASWPAWAGNLAPRAPFTSVPAYWQHAATWLDSHPDGRTLLVPGSSFGDYRWGHTNDEPLEALARSSMAVRDAVPLGAPGSTRLLDGVGSELAGGRPSAGLAGALARAGVGRLLLRNDLDARASADPLAVVRATLAGSPGIRRVATFGPPLDGTEGQVADLVGSVPARRSLEVWDVEGGSPDVTVSALAAARRLGGGPEGTIALAAAGSADVPTLDVGAGTPGLAVAPAVVTDTQRRRDLDFGSTPGSGYGPTLPASSPVGSGRAAGDVLAGSPAAQTVARFAGDAAVRSSPSAADPRLPGWRGPGAQPASAFDGDPSTAWTSADTGGRRWLEVSWPRPHTIGTLRILPAGLAGLAAPARVRVTTDAGSVTGRADAAGTTVVVPPVGPTRHVRLDLLGAPPGSQVAVAEVGGLEVPERLVLPRETPVDAGRDTVLLTRSPDRGSCVPAGEWLCSPRLARPGEDPATWRREFTVSTAGSTAVHATVRARPGAALDRALDASLGYVATGSSSAVDHPAARPGAALDGDYGTAWVSAGTDAAPTLTVTLSAPRHHRSARAEHGRGLAWQSAFDRGHRGRPTAGNRARRSSTAVVRADHGNDIPLHLRPVRRPHQPHPGRGAGAARRRLPAFGRASPVAMRGRAFHRRREQPGRCLGRCVDRGALVGGVDPRHDMWLRAGRASRRPDAGGGPRRADRVTADRRPRRTRCSGRQRAQRSCAAC